MKANVRQNILLMIVLLFSATAMAQPDYTFKNAILISGANLNKGAIYRFPNVKSGVDALVTLSDITPGVILEELDGSSGYNETLQPTLRVPAWTDGYVEMTIVFVIAGTSTPVVQSKISLTCIDVDGVINHDGQGHDLHEFDEVNLGGGYVDFDMIGGQLSVSQTGDWFKGTNMAGVDYPGRDTSAKQVMFTTINVNVSTAIIRVGVNNQTAAVASRLRSVYFKKFSYLNSMLPVSSLLSFKAEAGEKKVVLIWQLDNKAAVSKAVIERSDASGHFKAIGEVLIGLDIYKSVYRFTDHIEAAGNYAYRLKLVSESGFSEYSAVSGITISAQSGEAFRIYPSNIQSMAKLSIESAQQGKVIFELIDYSGRIMYKQALQVSDGANTIALNSLAGIDKGNYIAVMRTRSGSFSQKVVKR